MLKRIIGTSIVIIVAGLILINISYNSSVGIVERNNVLAAPLANQKTYIPVIINNYIEETIFGVEMYDMSTKGGLDKMNEAGVTFLRHNDYSHTYPTDALIWTAVEPNKGTRNWSEMERLEDQLVNASSRGMNVILPVRSTPTWARDPRWSSSPCGPIDKSHYGDFAKFMYDVVKRYSQPPYNVKYWEIYNEPDYPIVYGPNPYGEPHGCWGTWRIPEHDDGYGNGTAYGEMLKVVYTEIKKADPEAQVLTGGVLLECDPRKPSGSSITRCEMAGHTPDHISYAKFLEGILVAGAGDSFDGVSVHSYDFFTKKEMPNIKFGEYYNYDWDTAWNTTGPVTVAKVNYVKELLAQYGVKGKDIYNTESGLLNNLDEYLITGICKPFDNVYESTKASYIVQQYVYTKVLGLRANSWLHPFGWRCTALLEKDLSPIQPAYDTFEFASKNIGPASFVREVTDQGSGVKIFEFQFQDSGSKFWVVWSLDGANHVITLPKKPLAVVDMTGNPVGLSGLSFTVTLTPHYIEY